MKGGVIGQQQYGSTKIERARLEQSQHMNPNQFSQLVMQASEEQLDAAIAIFVLLQQLERDEAIGSLLQLCGLYGINKIVFPQAMNFPNDGRNIKSVQTATIVEWFEPKCEVHVGEALGFLSVV
ncbi:hypothetical protein TSUD_173180 [Trifolium subterraneum]|nr:hypothetical protein TSUD_173180 [Trifolium subterraneum]